jgi:hypothetical protein
MIRVSECRKGLWNAHLDALKAGKSSDPPQELVSIGERRGSYVQLEIEGVGVVRSLTLRLGDRCDLELSGEKVAKEALVAVAGDLSLDALEASCEKRERGALHF